MNRTARTAATALRLRRNATAAPQWTAGERVENRQGQPGVVIGRHSRTQSVVSFDNGTELVMFNVSLKITQQ